MELPPLGKLPGLTSWEFAHLTMWSLSSPAFAGCHLHVSPDVFYFGGEGMVSSFILLVKRGDRLILHLKVV